MQTLSLGDKRLGAALLEAALLDDASLQKAINHQNEVGGTLLESIVDLGLISEIRLAQTLESMFGIPLVNLNQQSIGPEVLALLPAEKARELQAIPFAMEGPLLRVALVNPLDSLTLEELEDLTQHPIEAYHIPRSLFLQALETYYGLTNLTSLEVDTPQLGQLLLRKGWITSELLEQALGQHQQSGQPLGQVLLHEGHLTEEQLTQALAEQLGLSYLSPTEAQQTQPTTEANLALSRAEALRHRAVPLRQEGSELVVALGDPAQREAVQALLGRPLRFLLASPRSLDELLEQAYPSRSRLGDTLVREGKLAREALIEALNVQRRLGKSRPLGEVLVELGYVKQSDIEDALNKQRQGGGRLEDTLIQSGKIRPEMLAKSLATQLGYPYIDPVEQPPDPSVVVLIPEATVRRYNVFPHHIENGSLVVLMKDPRNIFAIDDLRMLARRDIAPAVATEQAITRVIERFYGNAQTGLEELTRELERKKKQEETLDTTLDDNALVKLVNSVLREAYLQDASDIHIEPHPTEISVRIRIDGALRDYMKLPKAAGPAIVSRIKIMGGLDIAERRLPQDGRVRYRDRSIDLDLRLSTLPTVYGEKVVMRLLRKAADIPEIEQLGFAPGVFERFQELIVKPYGILLITGPTGSGKSFSGFSILKRIATPDKNTLTVEDPVEYEIPGINQTQVNPVAGLSFARALRSFLRQDPDIIMVGEVRDSETAKIATEAALTGHLVIATLHTNDAAGAITRLEEMGVELFNVSASLIGVLAQRLVRRICENCKTPITPEPSLLRHLEMSPADIADRPLYRGTGCEHCGGTGYKGRMAIHELMVVTESVRKTIIDGLTATEIKAAARESGMKTLREDGLYKAFQGLTTLEEVMARTIE